MEPRRYHLRRSCNAAPGTKHRAAPAVRTCQCGKWHSCRVPRLRQKAHGPTRDVTNTGPADQTRRLQRIHTDTPRVYHWAVVRLFAFGVLVRFAFEERRHFFQNPKKCVSDVTRAIPSEQGRCAGSARPRCRSRRWRYGWSRRQGLLARAELQVELLQVEVHRSESDGGGGRAWRLGWTTTRRERPRGWILYLQRHVRTQLTHTTLPVRVNPLRAPGRRGLCWTPWTTPGRCWRTS